MRLLRCAVIIDWDVVQRAANSPATAQLKGCVIISPTGEFRGNQGWISGDLLPVGLDGLVTAYVQTDCFMHIRKQNYDMS
jgi:hypothetical protein